MKADEFLQRYAYYGLHRYFGNEERDQIVAALRAPAPEALPIKPDRIRAESFFDITLTFHSSRDRNEVYGWLERHSGPSVPSWDRPPSLLCPRCGADRYKEPCKEQASPTKCPMAGDARGPE